MPPPSPFSAERRAVRYLIGLTPELTYIYGLVSAPQVNSDEVEPDETDRKFKVLKYW